MRLISPHPAPCHTKHFPKVCPVASKFCQKYHYPLFQVKSKNGSFHIIPCRILFLSTTGLVKKRPVFERLLLPEYISNDILQYLINPITTGGGGGRLHYISPSNLRSLLLLLSLQLKDLCPYASIQGLIRPSPPRSRRDQSDRYGLNMVNPRAYL